MMSPQSAFPPSYRIGWRKLASVAMAALVLAVSSPLQARERVLPPEPSYEPWVSTAAEEQMLRAIDYYRRLVAAGGWPRLADRITLRPGDSGNEVAIVRRRLELSGDIAPTTSDRYFFDQRLEEAVKRYQILNGVEPTGIVYGITQRLMNVPAETRLKQLELNLGRQRELLPKVLATPKLILMNAASFELQAIRGGQVEVVSRTIAGKRATPTPVVSANLVAINLLPYWHVPGTIAKAALVPQIRKDPAYLFKEHIRVFSSFGGEEVDPATVNWWGPEAERYVFRQDPGPQNALGVLRMDMPNKHIVYMHDTPMKPLFDYFERAVSAGCVRVQRYLDVAAWALDGSEGWTRERIEQSIAAGQRPTIKLPAPIPVHFIYLTAWVEQGAIHFRNDLYNRDGEAFEGSMASSAPSLPSMVAP
jgi:murein L,D-transpeptidase YcbB/YkuD